MDEITVAIMPLPHASGLPLPAYQTEGAAAMDLYAAIEHETLIQPAEIVPIPCGFAMSLPTGYAAQVRPRSGLVADHGIGVANSPATIDSDYRGELKVLLINLGKKEFLVVRGMRIAQLIVERIPRVSWCTVAALTPTDRGSGGFGHTGF